MSPLSTEKIVSINEERGNKRAQTFMRSMISWRSLADYKELTKELSKVIPRQWRPQFAFWNTGHIFLDRDICSKTF